MNKTLKKVLALVLTMLMLMSVMVVASAESYVDPESGIVVEDVETTAPAEEEEGESHRMMYQIFVDFWVEIFNFFKYIFYDLWLGVPA